MSDVFRRLFSAERTFGEYKAHPPDIVLKSYLQGRLPEAIRPPAEVLEGLLKGELAEWGEVEVAAHVRTCKRCAARLEWLQLPFWKRWFQQAISERGGGHAERELVSVWRSAWALAAAALLLVVLGSIGTLYLQVARLSKELATIRLADEQEAARLQGAINKLEGVVREYEQSTAAAMAELKEIIVASTGSLGTFEGAKDERLIEVIVNRDLSGYVRIYERVRGEALFEGILKQGSSVMKSGQSFEISWPLHDGKDALTIKGWEKIKRTEKGWQAVSEPVSVGDNPMACGTRFIIFFPQGEERSCP